MLSHSYLMTCGNQGDLSADRTSIMSIECAHQNGLERSLFDLALNSLDSHEVLQTILAIIWTHPVLSTSYDDMPIVDTSICQSSIP